MITLWDPHHTYFLQNLKLIHENIVNNTEEKLVTKVNGTYLSYQIEHHRGPLFFKIVFDALHDKYFKTDKYLFNVVKNLKIVEYDSENVHTAASII